jgi:ABC-2 type transport system permease protein
MHGDVLGKDVAWVVVASAIVTAVFAPIAMRLYYREQ